MDQNFINKGFTDVTNVSIKEELLNVQKLIYSNTKKYLVEHKENLSVEDKVNLNFKEIPSQEVWSDLMKTVNTSNELKNLINSEGIKFTFKKIFKSPQPFEISTFRARFPNQERVLYSWHQDEGTWFLSKNNNHVNKYPATLWLSINGATKEDSIQLVKFSHNEKLYEHKFIKGQGFFSFGKKRNINSDRIVTIETKPSECVIFHPLTIHRSVPITKISLRPRYSIDVRFFDKEFQPKFKTDFIFKIKRFFKKAI